MVKFGGWARVIVGMGKHSKILQLLIGVIMIDENWLFIGVFLIIAPVFPAIALLIPVWLRPGNPIR